SGGPLPYHRAQAHARRAWLPNPDRAGRETSRSRKCSAMAEWTRRLRTRSPRPTKQSTPHSIAAEASWRARASPTSRRDARSRAPDAETTEGLRRRDRARRRPRVHKARFSQVQLLEELQISVRREPVRQLVVDLVLGRRLGNPDSQQLAQ